MNNDSVIKEKMITGSPCKEWALVIEYNEIVGDVITKQLNLVSLVRVCNLLFVDYFIILHDKDFNEEGVLERPHYHLVVVLEKKKSKSRLINALSSLLDINKNMISCRETWSMRKDVRYLIHADEISEYKFTYQFTDVITNNPSQLRHYLNFSKDIDEKDLIDLCRSSRCLSTLIKKVGYNYYERHARLIDNLLNEFKSDDYK